MENKINTQLIHAFHNAMWEVESLKEFYSRSEKSLIDYRLKVEGNYKPGKIVGDIFDSILRLKSIEEKKPKSSFFAFFIPLNILNFKTPR